MPKLLFVAGEPGSGKSECVAKPLAADGLGLILHTDKVSQRAANRYQPNKSLGCKWDMWKHELDRIDNQAELEAAFYGAIKARKGHPVSRDRNIICEGVLSGHPKFRQIVQGILEQLGFAPDDVRTLAICLPWKCVQGNLKKRGRPEDQDTEFARSRSEDYLERLKIQRDVEIVSSAAACFNAAVGFLQ